MITACFSSSCVGVITTLGVGNTMPYIAFASSFGDLYSLRLIDGQVENLYAITTCSSSSCIGVITTLGVGLAVPLEAVASGLGDLYGLRLVDSQVENLDAAITLVGIVTTFSISLTMPLV